MPTVLLVDDDPMILEYCHQVLAGLRGLHVLTAHSGAEAMEIATRHAGPIDLLVADIAMPGIDGAELSRHMELIRPETRVLLMSGYASGGFALKDSWHFLPKPFRPGDLLSKAEAILATG